MPLNDSNRTDENDNTTVVIVDPISQSRAKVNADGSFNTVSTVQTIGTSQLFNIDFGAISTAPAYPAIKPLLNYIVPVGKTLKVRGVICKTSASSTYLHLYKRTVLWKFSATALAIPVAPTLTAKTIATSGLTPLSIYRYKIAAYNAIGAVTGTEASVTLTGTLNSVSLSWTAVTGALYYRIFRTTANGASNTQTLAGETELTSFVDIKADANLNPITAPAGNTTSGSVNGDAYAANLAPSAIMVDTLSAITAATPLDVIYKNIYGETKYVTVTPAVALGGQVELALSGSGNTIADNRITKPDNVEITNIDVGLQDITSVSNTPVTGAFNIVGNIHLFTCSSSVVNKFETEFFRDPFIFSAGEEIVIGTSANTAVTTGARVDITLITSLE